MKRLPAVKAIDRLENATVLDPVVNRMQTLVTTVVKPRWLRDLLHGVPIGHPLHPLLVQVPVGAWLSAAVLDAVPGTRRSAHALIGVGILGALPSAIAGYTDWARLHEQQMRVGIVHSSANVIATSLYAASFIQRSRGKHSSGKLLGYAGFLMVMGGGYLGGHLSYRQASGANHTEDVPHRFSPGWHPLARLDDIPESHLEQRIIDETPLLVFRRGDDVMVLSDVCSHLSGPLHEGELVDDDGPCVTCPWHGSVFSLENGDVVHGPATAGQPRFETRVADGMVEVCLPGAG